MRKYNSASDIALQNMSDIAARLFAFLAIGALLVENEHGLMGQCLLILIGYFIIIRPMPSSVVRDLDEVREAEVRRVIRDLGQRHQKAIQAINMGVRVI